MAFYGFTCPKCSSPMRPMNTNKGYSCAASGNRFLNGKWSVCDGVRWNAGTSAFLAKKVVERAAAFPTIARPTDEQRALKAVMGESPQFRGGRCIIVDAGPGTAKTTTMAWGMEAVFKRLGNLANYGLRAFNVNASEVLQAKLPLSVSDIATLNSAGGRAQGYKRQNYDKNKSYRLYKDLTSHLDPKDRPNFGVLGKVLERSRDLCLFAPASDKSAWAEIIATVFERFPGLAKKAGGREKFILEYLPALANNALSERGKIDLQEQLTRPVTQAIYETNWTMPSNLPNTRAADWTQEDVQTFARLIRAIKLPQQTGLVVDEAQDLSLAQVATTLAQTWRSGELMLIGDDQNGNPGEQGYKAGQAIYGWRGAFGGCLNLIARLWEELTGEAAIRKSLTVTFRHSDELCESYRPLNSIIRSGREAGYSAAFTVGGASAFEAWLNLPQGMTGLWITRTNAAIVPVFLDTLRECQDCTIRGGGDFGASIDSALYDAAGACDGNGEYRVSLGDCVNNLRNILAETSGDQIDPNSMDGFMLGVCQAIIADPPMLSKANITTGLTVGNVKRFVMFYADKESRRVLTTVYRCKGDEADLAVVADVVKFNESWGDAAEDAACRHVAASRGKRLQLYVGKLSGTVAGKPQDEPELMATLAR